MRPYYDYDTKTDEIIKPNGVRIDAKKFEENKSNWDVAYWRDAMGMIELSESFIERFKKIWDSNPSYFWRFIIINQKLSENFLDKYNTIWDGLDYKGNLLWALILVNQKLSIDFLDKYADKWDLKNGKFKVILWVYVIQNQKLSESFIEKYKDKWDLKDINNRSLWYYILNKNISVSILLKFYDKFKMFLSNSDIISRLERNSKIKMLFKFIHGG